MTTQVKGSVTQNIYDDFAATGGAGLVGLANGTVKDAVNYVTPQMFGAKADGVTDDGPAFRAMCAYRKTNSGAMKVPNGTYYFATYDPVANSTDEYALFNIPSNCAIYGETFGGVVLKIDNAVQTAVGYQRVSFIGIPPTSSNVIVGNFVGDMSALTLNHSFHTYALVQYNGDNIYLKNLKMDRPKGRWGIVTGQNTTANNQTGKMPTNVLIEDVIFTNVGKNADSTQTDFAGVYIGGYKHSVRRVQVYNDSTPLTNCSGIEIHTKDETTIDNCYFKNIFPGIYAGIQGVNGTTITYGAQERTKISNCRFINCAGGLVFIDAVTDFVLENCSFCDCRIPTADNKFGWGIYSTRSDTTGADSGILQEVKIKGCKFSYSSAVMNQGPHIRCSGLQISMIAGNSFIGGVSQIQFLSGLTPTSLVGVRGNTFLNPYNSGYNQGDVWIGDVPSTGGAFTPANINQIKIHGNQHSTSDSSNNLFIAGSPSNLDTTDVAACTIEGDSQYGFTNGGKVHGSTLRTDAPTGFTSNWTQSSGTQPAIGNGAITMEASVVGKKVNCEFSFLSGSSTTYGNSGTAWAFSLPYTNGPRDVYGVATISSGGSFAVVEIEIPANTSYFTMGYNGQSVRSGFPFANASGEKIHAQFSYFTE